MTTNRPTGPWRLFAGVLGCLSLSASAARAEPVFEPAGCTVKMTAGPAVVWEISGNTTVKNLPAGPSNIRASVEVYGRANGTATWTRLYSLTLTTTTNGGTQTLDTGFLPLAAPPGRGDEFMAKVSGEVVLPGMPGRTVPIAPPAGVRVLTPNP